MSKGILLLPQSKVIYKHFAILPKQSVPSELRDINSEQRGRRHKNVRARVHLLSLGTHTHTHSSNQGEAKTRTQKWMQEPVRQSVG